MQTLNIGSIDLNLFVVFEAIYREGSITRAASLLSLSQPAVSHALARLRDRLEDPLFVRRGRDMVPTPRARELIMPVREALHGLQGCLTGMGGFEPGQARRTFVLALRSGLEACVLPGLMRMLADEAPGVDVQSLTVGRRELASTLAAGRLDLAIDVQLPVDAEISQQHLMDVPLVVMLRADHPLATGPLTLESYLVARHVLVSSRRRGPGLEDFGLAQAGYHRQIALRCQHHQSAMATVGATDLLLTLPRVLAEQLPLPNVVIRELPVRLPPLSLYLYWHRDQEDDPALRWLRSRVLVGQ
ncbi:LysR family transcriptional regulator [Isoalcanivorax pacificus W11-5]|uniref:LysR family transcriptional regulator n=1 Tax=Isoalcanivorax pacificus W11-5 TaxID=391936 RepID=A0A0B4XRH5_9GAMM|nr:LysR family transcriptional regulator [Isoalcanivorax pacificus]AJD49806.1 LysR family transcriptional regulator [Isoalcanivorax pacificus W11-5]